MTDTAITPSEVNRSTGLGAFNMFTGVVLAIAGFVIGAWIGGSLNSTYYYVSSQDQNDLQMFTAYLGMLIGWFVGLGFLNYPISRMLGAPPSLPEKEESTGSARYFKATSDHKVVGNQYLLAITLFFLIGGLNAMLIRVELLRASPPIYNANAYLSLVGEHGTMMMMMMTSGIMGPFANYLVPIMIGSQRMAFPRVEAFTFWLIPPAGIVLLSALFYGGFQTGWTGYAPLSGQSQTGMDAYAVAFMLAAASMTLTGLNILATVFTHRAPGMTWTRLPIFVWGAIATAVCMLLAAPVLISTLLMTGLDRSISTSFFSAGTGGSPFLFENLFWVFGHPEVYILAIPGMAAVLEILPVFSRKPIWGYRLAVGGLLGIAFLSFTVWQHHLFDSGMNSNLRPFFMFTTEMISVPTGIIFVAAMGILWRAKITFTVPMLFCLAWFFNFLIGGVSGVFNSDVPADVTDHGSFMVMAHFHYTIMGGLVFAFFASIYYWAPRMTGMKLDERLGRWHFWTMFIFFNTTFLPLFALGMMGMPRRVVVYAHHLQLLNDWVSISAFLLGGSMVIFIVNVIWSYMFKQEPAEVNPWNSRSLEFQLPLPTPVKNFDRVPTITGSVYDYGLEGARPVADLPGIGGGAPVTAR